MMRRILQVVVTSSMSAVCLCADDATVSGPTLGYTVDPAQATVRPIFGLPGSALLGPASALPFTATKVLIAPGGGHLLAQEKETGRWQLIPDSRRPAEAQALADLMTDADRIVFSANGAAAALYSANRQQVQVLRGLPGAPAVGRTIDLSAMPGLLSALAVTGTGDGVLMSLSTEAGALLLYAAGDSPARQIGSAGRIVALSFAPGDADALWADAGRNQFGLLRDVAGAAELQVLSTDADGVAEPVAVAADEARYLAVMAAGKLLSIPRRAGGESKLLDCSCSANGLTALTRSSLWRINDGSDGPLWVLDAAAGRLFFVPAGGQE